MSAPRSVVPRKVFEGWFTVHDAEGRRVGRDWIFWEPHADRTAWFERQVELAQPGAERVDRHLKARFATGGDWPELTWARYRDGARSRELAGGAGHVLPSLLAPVIAATAPTAPEATVEVTLLQEDDARLVPGYKIVSHGPTEVEVPGGGERISATRFTLEREGNVEAVYLVDQNRRLRRMEAGGLHSILATKAEALAALG